MFLTCLGILFHLATWSLSKSLCCTGDRVRTAKGIEADSEEILQKNTEQKITVVQGKLAHVFQKSPRAMLGCGTSLEVHKEQCESSNVNLYSNIPF